MISGYQLTKAFYAELSENEEMQVKAQPHHQSLYTWICELRNRTNMEIVDLPRDYTLKMSLIGSPVKLASCLKDLEKWGFIDILSAGTAWGGATKVRISCSFLNKYRTSTEQEVNSNQTSTEPQSSITKTNKTDKTNKTISPDSFDQFWQLYGKKEDRKKCLDKWQKIPEPEKAKILEHVPKYIQAKPDPQYRKNPLTYLNGECWNDPVQSYTPVIPLIPQQQAKQMVY